MKLLALLLVTIVVTQNCKAAPQRLEGKDAIHKYNIQKYIIFILQSTSRGYLIIYIFVILKMKWS
jgi:hypothetical protein